MQMRRRSWSVLLAVAALALVSTLSVTAGGATAGLRLPKSYQVASKTVVFTDRSRQTPAYNGFPTLPYRTLSTLVVYPEQPSRQHREFPLVVFSHGFGGTAASLLPTLQSLASDGYVVASPDFPLSTTGLPAGLDLLDYASQPADVSFVITQMLKLDRTNGSPVYQQIDAHRVGVAGHSLGAVTTLAVSYNSCCHDARIGAAVEIDGELNVPIGPVGNFKGTYFKGHNPPLLVVNGTKDTIGPYAVSKAIYAKARAPKYFLSLVGAPHQGFSIEPWSPVFNNTIAAFFNRYLGTGQTVAQIERAANKPGVTTIQINAH